jgi:hypothetical protein
MNGYSPPDYFHADLLHPARRLWKTMLPDCSQGTIETNILGLDRAGDTPGALAPDIWFSFLRNGDTAELAGICDHNVKDIAGLSSLFIAMAEIAASPLAAADKFGFDVEALALRWRDLLFRRPELLGAEERLTGEKLFESAVKQGYPRAVYVRAIDVLKTGRHNEGVKLLTKLSKQNCPDDIKAAALRSLAIDSEWRGKNAAAALEYTKTALALAGIRQGLRTEMECRLERLQKKI